MSRFLALALLLTPVPALAQVTPLYPQIAHGTAFPASPVDNQQFCRDDRDICYFYDSTATSWLSLQQFTLSLGSQNGTATSQAIYAPVPYKGTYSLWLVGFDTTMLRGTASPDEWDVLLSWRHPTTLAETTIATQDGSADSQNVLYARTIAIGAVLDTTATSLRGFYSEIDDGGTCVCSASLRYRLVG